MCGVTGIVSTGARVDLDLLTRMSAALEHRGPDDHGHWTQHNVAFAQRRLAVVDLTAAGHQPMPSADGTWMLVYNGEIYNAREIRAELSDVAWRGSSDTEVLVEAIARYGVEAAVAKAVGMFAFAAYNTQSKELWLCRDRLGIKPLYYGWLGEQFVFSSELRSFARDTVDFSLNRNAVHSFLRYSYIPAPATIFNEIRKLPAGSLLHLQTHNIAQGELPAPQRYWDLRDSVGSEPLTDEVDAERQLLDALRVAVRDRLIADVPLGAFLSGGYDSSLVCALMQEQSNEPINTFTIGFNDKRYNEAQHAADIAAHLGTHHTELYVDETDMLDAVAQLPALCDEPFADPSILPTYLVCRMAREHVTVALSGDGGDELFWGYNRYHTAERMWGTIGRVPAGIRRSVAAVCGLDFTQQITRHVPAPAWGGRRGSLSQKLATAGEVLHASSQADLYHALLSHWKDPAMVCPDGEDLRTPYNDPTHWTHEHSGVARMALQDTLTYLPDDILTKVDRASMAVSLEARVPLLDHRVVELTQRLAPDLRLRDDQPKYLLKKILNRYVPAGLTDRPKMGFGVPLDSWLRGPLESWADRHLNPDLMRAQQILDADVVQTLWQAHRQGRANNAAKLWDVLMLQVWLASVS